MFPPQFINYIFNFPRGSLVAVVVVLVVASIAAIAATVAIVGVAGAVAFVLVISCGLRQREQECMQDVRDSMYMSL